MTRHLRIIALTTCSIVIPGVLAVAQEAASAAWPPAESMLVAAALQASQVEQGEPGAQERSAALARPPAPPLDPRSWLQQRGITIAASHMVEAFGWTGPDGKSAQYLGSYAPSLTLDLAGMRAGRGQVHVGAQVLRRRAAEAETLQAVSNLEAPAFDKIAEAWYADDYFGGRLSLKAGWHYADAEFGVTAVASSFLNASYGASPTTPMPAYPEAALGATATVTPRAWLSVRGGFFRGATLDSHSSGRLRDRPFEILEVRLSPFGERSRMTVGGWRRGPRGPQGRAEWMVPGNHGLYAIAEHRFGTRGDGVGGEAGEMSPWAAFVQVGWAPADRNEVTRYLGAGVTRLGWLRARPDDEIGVGITSAQRAEGGRETGLELFYRLQLPGGLFVQPDLQWIGGRALATGVRLGLTL